MDINFYRKESSIDIRFYREESSKELGIKADCNYLVLKKDIGKPFKLMPYSIYFCDDTRSYVAVKVKNITNVDTVLNSNDYEEQAEAFETLKDAKEWIYYDIKGSK